MKTTFNVVLLFVLAISQAFASTTASRQYNFVNDKNNGVPILSARVDGEFDNIITKLNQKAIISSSAPSSPISGELWYDTSHKQLKQYRNSEWVIMGIVHVGAAAPTTSQTGDLWYDTATFTLKGYNGSTYVAVTDLTSPGPVGSVTPDTGRFSTVGIGTFVTTGSLIVASGNVGLGSTAPGTALDVNGTVRATAFSTSFFGAAVSKSDNTAYLAATDGVFVGVVTCGTDSSVGKIVAYTDSSNPPTTAMGAGNCIMSSGAIAATTASNVGGFNIPVKKGNYYKGTLTSAGSGSGASAVYYFVPLGS